MKTSKKILLVVAGFIIALLIITMLQLRNGVQSLQSKAELKHKYKAVSVSDFEKLDFSSHFVVKIIQGKECKVEMTAGEDSILKPRLENLFGTLHFTVDTAIEKENTDSIFVRISMPSLQVIKAVGGTKIHLENFQSDSLSVILENGCVFTEYNNTIKHTFFKTSGENRLDITKTL
jgi:hypothetical protein